MADTPPEIHEYKGKLVEFFPPDDPDSPWLLRLMIIRDDLDFEVRNLGLDKDAGPEDAWRTTYFLRRISVTLLEAASILGHEVGKVAKKPEDEAMKKLAPSLREAINIVHSHRGELERLRDSIGAHVRPQNADKDPDVEKRVLEQLPNMAGTIRMNHSSLANVSYRELSGNSLLFAWPDADDDAKIVAKHEALRTAIFAAVPEVFSVIDSLLARHFWKHGMIEPPEGYDFGVLNEKKQRYERVEKP